MAAIPSTPTRTLLLAGEPWDTYVRLLKIFDERRHLRISFDRGNLEIMTLSPEHEGAKFLIARLLTALTEELGLPIAGYGSMTFKRRGKQKGLEPDECYWIQNEAKVRDLKKKFDPRTDPAPDIVVEVDIESSSVNRMGIYRTLKVPEVWRYDGTTLAFHLRGAKGYVVSPRSLAFAGLLSDDLLPFLALRGQQDTNAIVRQFRSWVQRRIAASWQ